MAIRYFEDTLATPGVEEDIRERIAIMLPAARKEIQTSRFYGTLQLGIGYNSNVPGAPGFGYIRSYGNNVLNPGPYYNTPGPNVTLLGDVLHVYDFQNQRGDTWETRVSGIGSWQLRLSSLSSGFGEVSSGPRLALAPDLLPGVTVHPYVIGSLGAVAAGGSNTSVGGGVTLRIPVGADAWLEPGIEGRRLDISESNYQLLSASLINSGPLWTASLAARWAPLERLSLNAKAFLGRNAAAYGATSSRRVGVEAAAKYDFDPPFAELGWRWSVAPFVNYTSYRFDSADPFVDPFVTRADRQWRTGLQFDMPVSPMFGVNALVQFSRSLSNVPNYRATSWSGLLGPTLRF